MEIILCIVFGIFIIFSYTLGLKARQQISNNKKIKLIPKLERKNEIIEEEEQDRNFEMLMQVAENIEAYDGTANNQKEEKINEWRKRSNFNF